MRDIGGLAACSLDPVQLKGSVHEDTTDHVSKVPFVFFSLHASIFLFVNTFGIFTTPSWNFEFFGPDADGNLFIWSDFTVPPWGLMVAHVMSA